MDTSTWIWTIVVIIVVLVIIGVLTALGRKCRRALVEQQVHEDREKLAGSVRMPKMWAWTPVKSKQLRHERPPTPNGPQWKPNG